MSEQAYGRVSKIYADVTDCVDSNGNGVIDTSTSGMLTFGTDECIAWTNDDYPRYHTVAWTRGKQDPETCEQQDELVWSTGKWNGGDHVLLLDGETGVELDLVTLQGLPDPSSLIIGSAVDVDDNLWAVYGGIIGTRRFIRVDAETLDYQIIIPPADTARSVTVDSEGYVWLCGGAVARFDPATELFQTANVGGWRSCMAEGGQDGLLWVSSPTGLIGVDRHTLTVEATWPTPTSGGVAIDRDGDVWNLEDGSAHRVDPITGDTDTYSELPSRTLSPWYDGDMTGHALAVLQSSR
ncbi:MAG: hypothetical protein AAF799_25660 [Myxococcota bacterium]